MGEIQVGEYVRTKYGIAKIIENSTEEFEEVNYIMKGEIVKHSKDITDLIEKDDFVNGCRVYEVEERGITVYQKVGDSSIDYNWITKDEIQTILTHEQYENNVYRIGE